MEGLKFKYLAFSNIEKDYKGISVFVDDIDIATGSINEVLSKLSKLDEDGLLQIMTLYLQIDILICL